MSLASPRLRSHASTLVTNASPVEDLPRRARTLPCLARRSLSTRRSFTRTLVGEGGSLIPFAPLIRSLPLTLPRHSGYAIYVAASLHAPFKRRERPPPLRYGAASSRRRFRGRRLRLVGD